MFDAAAKIRLEEISQKCRLYNEQAIKDIQAAQEKHLAATLPLTRMALQIAFAATVPEMIENYLGFKLGVLERVGLGADVFKPIGQMLSDKERAHHMEVGTTVPDLLHFLMKEGRITKGMKPTEKVDIGIGKATKTTDIPGGVLHTMEFASTDEMREFLAKKFDLRPSEVDEMLKDC